jgi:DNA invertase Pin-like site-specific DNA recombinase
MNYIGYIRVSTREQAANGISLQEQITTLNAWAAMQGHHLVAIYEDRGISGKNLKRPGLQQALHVLKHGLEDTKPGGEKLVTEVHGLVVAYLDRLSRSVLDVCRLVEYYFHEGGYELAAARESLDTTSSMGRAIIGILSVMAQWQREQTNEKILAGLDEKRRAGKLIGSVPWGYRLAADGETLRPARGERRMMAQALELRRGGLSLRKVCAQLKSDGRRNRNNSTQWYPNSLAGLLRAAEKALREGILVELPNDEIRVADDVATAAQRALASPEATAERAGVRLISQPEPEDEPPSEDELAQARELMRRAGYTVVLDVSPSSRENEEVAP